MSNINKKIIIIGAGLGGLALAPLLAKEGFQVTVIDNNSSAGGVAGRYEEKGFTFDTGPTWYLMPEVFEHYFSLFNKQSSDYYTLHHLDPSYRIYFNNRQSVDIKHDLTHTRKVFDALEKNGGQKLDRYLSNAKYKYTIALREFLYKEYNSISDFFNKRLIKEGMKLNIFRSLEKYSKKYFSNIQARQILQFNTVFLGCSPKKCPALYSLMSHVDIKLGVYFPAGGIYQLPLSLQRLGREYGVQYYFNTSVLKIIVKDKKSTAVLTDNGLLNGDAVVVAGDYHFAETELLEKQYQTYSKKYWARKTLAPTACLVYLGINKKLRSINHHNLYLSDTWDSHFKSIFKKPAWPEDPSYYISIPSVTDPSFAPRGCESLYILVPVAPGMNDNAKIVEPFTDKIICHFESLIDQPIQKNIVIKKIFTHNDYLQKFNSFKGCSMGLAHTLFQTAVFRPGHKSKKVSNLYYTGHYTHPGIGMPMVIIAAQLVAGRIRQDYG